jgi:hypothetical protein
MSMTLKPGQPCAHPGCASHVKHSCEECGRFATGNLVLVSTSELAHIKEVSAKRRDRICSLAHKLGIALKTIKTLKQELTKQRD